MERSSARRARQRAVDNKRFTQARRVEKHRQHVTVERRIVRQRDDTIQFVEDIDGLAAVI